MNKEVKDKLRKVYELVNRGATEGERVAAKRAIDRLLKKHNIEGLDLENLDKDRYSFKYTDNLELRLFSILIMYFIDEEEMKKLSRRNRTVKEVYANLKYLDYVTIEASYSYFRRHMRKEWNRLCLPQVLRCRKPKTRNKKRGELQELFLGQYLIASKLYKDGDLIDVDLGKLSDKEREQRRSLDGIEGGHYNKQVTNRLLLEVGCSQSNQKNEQLSMFG